MPAEEQEPVQEQELEQELAAALAEPAEFAMAAALAGRFFECSRQQQLEQSKVKGTRKAVICLQLLFS